MELSSFYASPARKEDDRDPAQGLDGSCGGSTVVAKAMQDSSSMRCRPLREGGEHRHERRTEPPRQPPVIGRCTAETYGPGGTSRQGCGTTRPFDPTRTGLASSAASSVQSNLFYNSRTRPGTRPRRCTLDLRKSRNAGRLYSSVARDGPAFRNRGIHPGVSEPSLRRNNPADFNPPWRARFRSAGLHRI